MNEYAFRISAVAASVVILWTPVGFAEDQPAKKEAPVATNVAPAATLTSSLPPAGVLDQSLANEVKAATVRGLDWLASKQNDDGSWSEGNFPALTALALQAFVHGQHPNKKQIIEKAAKYIVSCVQTNGGIYREVAGVKGGGLSNYNTAICMMALHATGDPAYTKIIQDARKFIAGAQYMGDGDYKGGFGYDADTKRAYTDLLNTYYTVEAMSTTAGVEDKRGKDEKKVDINWDETVKFIERMQNKPGSGDETGGFYYNPTDPKAGTSTNAAGVVVIRSYGSITYAGMLALIHANVSRDDVRVRSAYDWATKHWSLDENPGMGDQGLYFFYNILSKCLSAYGQDIVTAKDNKQVNWKVELANKLVKSQKIDEKTGQGYWVNSNNKYWENNPILVTAYTIIALENL
jgi:squalene-hopene/tetraprenyl-beta-curcumene cyclase